MTERSSLYLGQRALVPKDPSSTAAIYQECIISYMCIRSISSSFGRRIIISLSACQVVRTKAYPYFTLAASFTRVLTPSFGIVSTKLKYMHDSSVERIPYVDHLGYSSLTEHSPHPAHHASEKLLASHVRISSKTRNTTWL